MIKISLKINPLKRISGPEIKSSSISFKVPEDWIEDCKNYLLENGIATQADIDALTETTGTELVIESKDWDLETLPDTFTVDPSTMTISYGPYVVDDALKTREFTKEMLNAPDPLL